MNSIVKKSVDHRELGAALELFYIDEEIGRGLPIWLPRGYAIREALERWMAELESEHGYERVLSPALAKPGLFVRSGHLPYYADSMFPAMKVDEGEEYRLRPMNCPHHHRIYDHKPRSYRDLPLRIAEFGQVYRFEDSGAIAGLSRARALCINDAHIYCRRDQLDAELDGVLALYRQAFRDLGIERFQLRLSKGDAQQSEKFVAQAEAWAWAEGVLREALRREGSEFEEAVGEAAFYGPKIDVLIESARGKMETISTVQLDFVGAERFDLKYRAADGSDERPYILHRAPIGSFERIVAYLLEKDEGRLPLWLSPEVVRVLPLGSAQCQAGERLVQELRRAGVRALLDPADESLANRIKKAHADGAVMVAVLGEREVSAGSVSVRSLRGGGSAKVWPLDEYKDSLALHVKMRKNDEW